MKKFDIMPGDLCQYMSRILLVVEAPYKLPDNPHQWVDSIEIDNNTTRKVRCDTLTLIQRAEEKING